MYAENDAFKLEQFDTPWADEHEIPPAPEVWSLDDFDDLMDLSASGVTDWG